MKWSANKDSRKKGEARRLAALNLALVALPKSTKAHKVVELAGQFEVYLYDGSVPEAPEE